MSHLSDWPKFLADQAKNLLAGYKFIEFKVGQNPLANLPLFAELSEAELQLVFEQMRLKEFAADELIFTRDDESDALYVVKEGRINLLGPDDKKVEDTCHPGGMVGQTEFLLKQPRARTARAATAVTVWYLDDLLLTGIVTSYPNIGLQLGLALGRGIAQFHNYLANQISKVPLLHGLSDIQQRVLARYLSPHRCLPQEIIYRAGDPPTGIFIIERGSVLLSNGPDDEECVELVAGDTFGEQAVLYETPHDFTAQATSEMILWLLSPADFAALAAVSPSTAATLSHNLFTILNEAVVLATRVIEAEINALRIVAGEQHPLLRKLRHARRTLTWVKNNQIVAK